MGQFHHGDGRGRVLWLLSYAGRFSQLKQQLLEAIPNAEVFGKVGRRTSFEVTVNDVLVHSKLATNKFPDFDETVSMVTAVAGGAEPEKITKMTSGTCNIL